jgi:hypothetical protein
MYQNTYRINKAFLIALSAVTLLLLLLSLLSFFLRGSTLERFILTTIFIAVALILLEAVSRKVLTGDHGVLIKKFLKERELLWEDITQAGMVVFRKRVYLLLTTTKGFLILSNSYEGFSGLLRDIVDHVDKEKIDEEVRSQMENPIRKISDVVSMWIAATILIVIIAIKVMTS